MLPRTFTPGRRSPVSRLGLIVALAAITTLATAATAAAQSVSSATGRRSASREALETAAENAERLARSSGDRGLRERKRQEAIMIRERLRDGDFQPGSRIFLFVSTDSVVADTFTVRSDRKLLVPNLPPISLTGVLDSELQDHLTKELARYIRDPEIRAQGMVRVTMVGAIGRPGFYSLPMDQMLSDAIMVAGGPGQATDLSKIEVRRGDRVAIGRDAVQEAFRLGLTLSDVGIRSGDEIVVPQGMRERGWAGTLRTVSIVAGSLASILWLVRLLN